MRTMQAMALFAVCVFAAACVQKPTPEIVPTVMSAPSATPSLVPTGDAPVVAPTPSPTPASTIETASFEEDCMAACHVPDPNDYFGAGAKPLPANHTDRTTCLNCHTAESAPALPATHTGRLDAACRGCHK